MSPLSFGDGGEIRLDRLAPGIERILIDRPARRNACNRQAWCGLRAALEAAAERGARVAILGGTGGHFCSGDDILDASEARKTPEGERSYAADIRHAFRAVTEAPFPVIAAVEGYCLGGGLSLAMCCDLRVGTAGAALGIPASKLGFTYPPEQCSRLMTLVGLGAARRMLFDGERIDGARAHALGLLDELAEGDVFDTALSTARMLASRAPLSLYASKRIFQALAISDLAGHREEIAGLMARVEASADLREGARAFAEKRPPVFTGH